MPFEKKLCLDEPGDAAGLPRPNCHARLVRAHQHSKKVSIVRDSLFHERRTGERAAMFEGNGELLLRVSCRATAGALEEEDPYALAISFEVRVEAGIAVYEQVRAHVLPQVGLALRLILKRRACGLDVASERHFPVVPLPDIWISHELQGTALKVRFRVADLERSRSQRTTALRPKPPLR